MIVLVGERGREVREFLERDLGSVGLARSVVVVATSDEPALIRLNAAYLGTAVAEFFRDTGRDVLLMMDSVTRLRWPSAKSGWPPGNPLQRAAIRRACLPSCPNFGAQRPHGPGEYHRSLQRARGGR